MAHNISHENIEETYTKLKDTTAKLLSAELELKEAEYELEQAEARFTLEGLEGSNAQLRKADLAKKTEPEREMVEMLSEKLSKLQLKYDLAKLDINRINLHARLSELDNESLRLRLSSGKPRRKVYLPYPRKRVR